MTTGPTFQQAFRDILVTCIDYNPENPRGLPVRAEDSRFIYLRESVAEFGILVPVVVIGPREDDRYLLIDGERRLEAARATGMEVVPAYVLSQSLNEADIRRTMFHIHQNREQWNSAQQCRACEPLYEELRATCGDDFRALAQRFAAITGTPLATAEDRIRFLCWPVAVKQHVYHPGNNKLYTPVVEIEEHIIQAAQKNYPEYFARVATDDVRTYLFWKYAQNPIGVRAIRSTAGKIAESRYTGQAKGAVVEILVRLAKEEGYAFDDAWSEFVESFPEIEERRVPSPRSLLTRIQRLSQLLDEYEWERLKSATGRSAASAEDLVAALGHLVEAAEDSVGRVREMAG